MKLGTGNNKYKIKFKYIETGRISIKNVYADNIEEAKRLFNKEYESFEVEVLKIELMEE